MVGEADLVRSANGDFVALLAAFLVIAIVTMSGLLIRWVMTTIPEQMRADREAICQQLKEMVTAIRESSKEQAAQFEKCFRPHDEQAKEIKKNVEKTAIVLDSRPCINGKIRE